MCSESQELAGMDGRCSGWIVVIGLAVEKMDTKADVSGMRRTHKATDRSDRQQLNNGLRQGRFRSVRQRRAVRRT